MKPGTKPGLPATEYAMYPASTGSINAKAADPTSEISLSVGEFEKSGPDGVIGTKAIDMAMRIPPHAMNGIAYETPVNRCWRSFFTSSNMETLLLAVWKIMVILRRVDMRHLLE